MPTFREDAKIGSKVPLIKTADLNDKSVTEKKLADGSITKDKIADESVSAEKLQSGLRSTIVSTHDKAIELDKKKASITDVDYALECLENKIGDRVVVEGNVTNLPDDEDLTSVRSIDGREVMKLNDRAYEPSNFSGKGYKILRKNIQRLSLPTATILVSNIPSSSGDIAITINGKTTTVALDVATDTTTAIIATKICTALKVSLDDYDVSVSSNTIVLTRNNSKSTSPSSIDVGNTTAGISVKDSITKSERKNVLTQDMIKDPNTIYEIRYDFDLDGKEISIKDNCALKFNGGSFKNGVLIGNNTTLINFDYKKNTCNYKEIFINTEPLYIENLAELENYNIPIGTKLTLTGENPVIAIRRATSNNNEVLWENKDGQKYLYNSSTLIVDHFGCKPNNKDLIDSNSRVIEKLTQYKLPIKFLSGTYYLRNIDLNLYKQRLYSFVGIESDAYGLSGIDSKNSAIDTDGSDLFLTFTSIESMHSIKLFWLKFKSKDLSGKVINVVSEKVTDISLKAQNCYFQGFDAVVRSKYYGTGLTIKNCTFRNCRTGISFKYACNLAYLFGCSFLNVGQCIRVHGTNAMIIKTEINCLYTGDDWETLELYCFYTAYDCKIDQVYFEPYGQHDSIYKFNILITLGNNATKIIANYMQFPRITAEPNKRITHVKFKNINPNYPYNHAKLLFVGVGDSATDDISNYPSFIKGEDGKGNALDIFATNILYNGKAITGTKYILSGVGGIPLSLKETNMLTTNKNLEKFSLYYPPNSQSVNKYNELIPESLRNNIEYYDDDVFCLMIATYNLDMILNITNSPNGLIDVYLNYRTPQATKEYIYLGTCNIINGKVQFRTTLNNIISGGQEFNISIGKQPDNDAYAKINGGTPFECTLKLDMTPV